MCLILAAAAAAVRMTWQGNRLANGEVNLQQ
jgi:hypothetical protein